jgi:hypothetical protein
MTRGVLTESGYEQLPLYDMEGMTKRQNLGPKPQPRPLVPNTKRNNFVPVVYRIPKLAEDGHRGHIDDGVFEDAKRYLPNKRRR